MRKVLHDELHISSAIEAEKDEWTKRVLIFFFKPHVQSATQIGNQSVVELQTPANGAAASATTASHEPAGHGNGGKKKQTDRRRREAGQHEATERQRVWEKSQQLRERHLEIASRTAAALESVALSVRQSEDAMLETARMLSQGMLSAAKVMAKQRKRSSSRGPSAQRRRKRAIITRESTGSSSDSD